MKKTALRVLQREVDENISQKNITEAVQTCKAVLEIYPKNIQTYHLLGKAFLEASRLKLAERVFDIILQVDPDDFVSHIGKSFIAESNGNLSLAVAHMERAFELQPANETLQDEIKRLIKLKTGVEPTKVRLTRGCLIKMYLRGKLYEQAISEIRIGLSESPKRIDFKVNLADCFYNLNKPIQAVETCIEINSVLPYCWKANQVLDQIISKNTEWEKDNLYRTRLVELDPYYAFMLPSTESIIDVPDIAVMIQNGLPTKEFEDEDWGIFLANAWKLGEVKPPVPIPPMEIDWDRIISDAIESAEDEPSKKEMGKIVEDHSAAQIHSTKKRFLEKLKGESKAQAKSDEIPDWILEKDGGADETATIRAQVPQEDKIKADQTSPEERASEQENQLEPIDLPNDQGETFTDDQAYHDEWRAEDIEPDDQSGAKSDPLEDTQRISAESFAVADMLLEAQKAVVGKNVNYSINIFRKLMEEKEHLEEVIPALETIVQEYPKLSDFSSLLGEAYTKAGQNEKAFQVFQEAQE